MENHRIRRFAKRALHSRKTALVLGILVVASLIVLRFVPRKEHEPDASDSLTMISAKSITICEQKALVDQSRPYSQILASFYDGEREFGLECADGPIPACCIKFDADKFGVRIDPIVDQYVTKAKAQGISVYFYLDPSANSPYVLYTTAPINDDL